MWAPDNSRQACSRCANEFGVFLRRHHCRNCGSLFCDACSNFYVSVTNPVTQPGVFSSGLISSSKNSGVQRVCYGCFHKEFAYVAVYTGFFGSLKTELCICEDDARFFLEEREDGIVAHLGTAKIVYNKKPNDPSLTNRLWEKAKGKGRKMMGDRFYEEQVAQAQPVQAPPSMKHLWPSQNDPRKDGFQGGQTGFNNNTRTNGMENYMNNNNNNNNNFGGSSSTSAAGATAAAAAASSSNTNNNSSTTSSPTIPNSNNLPDLPLPQFCLVAAMCLEGELVRLRFLQPDVHKDKAKLVLDLHKLAKEEFEAEGKFTADKPPFVEGVVLLDSDWRKPLCVETSRFFYRSGPMVDRTVEAVMKDEKFVLCSHRGGRPHCEIITGGKEARAKLFENADSGISSVVVTAFGEPIGHTCRDVSWRRQLVETADTEGLKLLYNNQNRVVFVASTIPSANADVRVSQTLWEIEQATAGQLRTTVQAWIWDPDTVDKKCILTPFLGGGLAPPSITPGQMDQVSSTLRRVAVGSKASAPIPTSDSSNQQQQVKNNNNNNNDNNNNGNTNNNNSSSSSSPAATTTSATLSAAPPRPGGATAAASGQAQQEASTRPAKVSQIPECPVCMDEYNSGSNKPLVLVCCGHSICAACWKGVLERKAANATAVPCPRCREEIAVTQRLVPNRTLLEQMSDS